MGRRRSEKPRLHKASGRAFIELGGKRIYLEAAYGTKEAEKEYNRLYGQWLANDRKPPPSKATEVAGITCGELAVRYLDEMKDYHSQQPRTYRHCRTAMSFLTKHFGSELVNNFTPASLIFIRKKLEAYGYVRHPISLCLILVYNVCAVGEHAGLCRCTRPDKIDTLLCEVSVFYDSRQGVWECPAQPSMAVLFTSHG